MNQILRFTHCWLLWEGNVCVTLSRWLVFDLVGLGSRRYVDSYNPHILKLSSLGILRFTNPLFFIPVSLVAFRSPPRRKRHDEMIIFFASGRSQTQISVWRSNFLVENAHGKFDVLTEVNISVTGVCDIAPCSLADVCRRFGKTYVIVTVENWPWRWRQHNPPKYRQRAQ